MLNLVAHTKSGLPSSHTSIHLANGCQKEGVIVGLCYSQAEVVSDAVKCSEHFISREYSFIMFVYNIQYQDLYFAFYLYFCSYRIKKMANVVEY